MSSRKFFKTVITVTVLSEDGPPEWNNLHDLHYLVEQAGDAERVKIRVLSVSWRELARDAQRAIEFDQSQLFRKIYSDAGVAGMVWKAIKTGKPQKTAYKELDIIVRPKKPGRKVG